MTELVVVMGVSGCGKSSVAEFIAERLEYTFIEADDFHSTENVKHMSQGKPLTDSMRAPWFESLQNHLIKEIGTGNSCVMSFSGLRKQHRQHLRGLTKHCHFIHLVGSYGLILQRIQSRQGHFMPAELLQSQYAALDDTIDENDVYRIPIDDTLSHVQAKALAVLTPLIKPI